MGKLLDFPNAKIGAQLKTTYTIECFRHYFKDGTRCLNPKDHDPSELVRVKQWEESFNNLVMTAGLNELVDGVFLEAPSGFTWYVGLIGDESPNVYAAGDTLASHSGWTEFTSYSEGARQAWTNNGAASSGSTSNSSSKAEFSISGSGIVGGAFLATASTGTSGILYGGGDFASSRSVENGDTLTVQATVSAAAV